MVKAVIKYSPQEENVVKKISECIALNDAITVKRNKLRFTTDSKLIVKASNKCVLNNFIADLNYTLENGVLVVSVHEESGDIICNWRERYKNKYYTSCGYISERYEYKWNNCPFCGRKIHMR